jgi:dTDP-4-dehydrorhamnose 3,5-epimerase
MANHEQVELTLWSLQQAMSSTGHWSDIGISAEALASQQPFCLDTMNFSQWLQFVFIPNMQALIDAKQVLPSLAKGQGIEPMATEFYKNTTADQAVIAVIRQLDDLLQG